MLEKVKEMGEAQLSWKGEPAERFLVLVAYSLRMTCEADSHRSELCLSQVSVAISEHSEELRNKIYLDSF